MGDYIKTNVEGNYMADIITLNIILIRTGILAMKDCSLSNKLTPVL